MAQERRVSWTARARLTSLAKVCQYLESVGLKPRNKSEIVDLAIETLANSLPGPAPPIDEAVQFFEQRQLDWRFGSRQAKVTVKNLEAADREDQSELDDLAKKLIDRAKKSSSTT